MPDIQAIHKVNNQLKVKLSEANKYARSHGYSIIHEYIDRAKSGRIDSREQFQKMLKDTAKNNLM